MHALMMANYLPLDDDPHVPEIVLKLRKSFEDRILELYKNAVDRSRYELEGVSQTVHVPYEVDGLHVIAVYHEPTGHFTQLIARSAHEQGVERPSYTISLFLTLIEG